MVSINETAPIYPRRKFLVKTLKRRIEGTYQTGQVIAGLTLELQWVPEPTYEPVKVR
jgi:hypothetical protein